MAKRVDIQKLRDKRVNEDYMLELRSHRTQMLSAWHARIGTVDRLYRGEWQTTFPDETVQQELPHVMNLVQVTLDDVSRLVTESNPSVRCFPASDTEADQKNAYLREAIAETYWERNHGDILAPKLAMDLAGAGACFLVVDATDKDIPCVHRIDPRMAFPDVHNGIIQDLLVAQTIKLRVAARLFPRLGLEQYDDPEICDSVELLEYYSADECVQAVVLSKGGSPIPEGYLETARWSPGVLPVAFAMLDSFDGEFRGMFDQISGGLNTKNRIVKLMLDYSDRLVYAPKVSKGLLNPEEVDGPDAHFRLDPNVADASMGRMGPAGNSPDLWRILEYLEREQRHGVSYPAQRGGDVSQSIASAAFVASTQGALTSTVRNLQRLLASLRSNLNAICFEIDEKHMGSENGEALTKPLVRPVGKKKEYTPVRDIRGRYDSLVLYGAGAGLDRMNADVRIIQHLSTGLISRETAREQIDYLAQDGEENDRIQKEMAETALVQKFLTEAPWNVISEVYALMAETGKPLPEAITQIMGEQQEQQAGPPVPGAPTGAPPGRPPEPESAQSQQLAIQKGQTEPKFQGPPITSVLVRNN